MSKTVADGMHCLLWTGSASRSAMHCDDYAQADDVYCVLQVEYSTHTHHQCKDLQQVRACTPMVRSLLLEGGSCDVM